MGISSCGGGGGRPEIQRRQPLTSRVRGLQLPTVLAAGARAAGLSELLKPENVYRARTRGGALQARSPKAVLAASPHSIAHPRAVNGLKRLDGDWGKTWLASNGDGSGAYRISPEGYGARIFEMELNERHFRAGGNPKSVKKMPSGRQGRARPAVGAAERLARLSRIPHASRQVAQCKQSKTPTSRRTWSMRTFVIRMKQHQAAVRQFTGTLVLRPCLQYRGS